MLSETSQGTPMPPGASQPTALPCENTVYDGAHQCGERFYTLQEPDGRVRHFCDSDCLRGTLQAEGETFCAALVQS